MSVITTKRTYQDLEAQGFVETIQGKGTFVAGGSKDLLRAQRLVSVEADLRRAIKGARAAGLEKDELHEMLDILAEGE